MPTNFSLELAQATIFQRSVNKLAIYKNPKLAQKVTSYLSNFYIWYN
jgi:hypothetical protein